VQLPQATHFCGLIFIVFPFRKKHKPGKGLIRWRGLESFDFARARLFPVLALKLPSSCEQFAEITSRRLVYCSITSENTAQGGMGNCGCPAIVCIKRSDREP
jgi:hypothetical protein